MKTPTKEKIEQLAHLLPWDVWQLLPVTDKEKLILVIIKTWEKIR